MRRLVNGLIVALALGLITLTAQAPIGPGQSPVVSTGTGGGSYISAGGVAQGPFYAPDGTALLPAYSFASEPTLGFWRSGAGAVTLQGALTTTGAITIPGGSLLSFGALGTFANSGANGIFLLRNNAASVGVTLKTDTLPVASACGAGSPAVVAGSSAFAGAVTVGTGGPATCTITFGGTAYPSAPHCSGAVETTTAANARAMGYSATTTVLTIVPATAWADGSVVNWGCVSSK